MDKSQIVDQALAVLLKWWMWAFWIVIGLVGKIGNAMYNGERLSSWKFIGSSMVACFIGYLASVFCISYCPEKACLIVPIATLVSDKIILVIMAMNWTKIIEVTFNKVNKKEE